MRGLKNGLIINIEYFTINFRIPNKTVDGLPAITSFTKHVYLIERSKTKMLIRNDILSPEMLVPNIDWKQQRNDG